MRRQEEELAIRGHLGRGGPLGASLFCFEQPGVRVPQKMRDGLAARLHMGIIETKR